MHRRVLPRCFSKFFSCSVAFVIQYVTRLPLVPSGFDMTMRQDSLHVTACSFASLQLGAFHRASSLGSHHQMPASYEAAWPLPRLDFHQQVMPSFARRTIELSYPSSNKSRTRHSNNIELIFSSISAKLTHFANIEREFSSIVPAHTRTGPRTHHCNKIELKFSSISSKLTYFANIEIEISSIVPAHSCSPSKKTHSHKTAY